MGAGTGDGADHGRQTPGDALDAALARLRDRATPFARSSARSRAALARRLLAGYRAIAAESVRAGCAHKGLAVDRPEAAEEWIVGPLLVVRQLRLYLETLERLAAGGLPFDPARVRVRDDGRVAVRAMPAGSYDRVLFAGLSGEVLMERGTTVAEVLARSASHQRRPPEEREGRICLVLGAGNVPSIPTLDVASKLFVEGKVCLLKMSPVNAYLGPFLESAFRDAIDAGWLFVAYGGSETGEFLCRHPLVDEVHLTGSHRTHDLIVWGPPGPGRDERRARRRPLLDKPVSCELGNISPVIVVPGPYSRKELAFQADSIAAGVANNASFNCNAHKLLVTSSNWSRREEFIAAVAGALGRFPLRRAYYPGAAERWARIVSSHAQVRALGEAGEGELPWALILDLDPSDPGEPCFREEPWCGVLAETALSPSDPAEFLEAAVEFVNQRVWGTLSATIVVHPRTLDDPPAARALERALTGLHYGAVGVNHWPGLIYGAGTLPWGAYPGSTPEEIQSGRGWVHNAYMLGGIEKSILRGPLVTRPRPPFFAGHRTADRLARRLVDLEASPSPWKLPGIFLDALRAATG